MAELPSNFKLGYGLISITCPKCPGITQITYVGEGLDMQDIVRSVYKTFATTI